MGDNRIAKIENLSHLKNLKRLFLGANQIRKIEGLDELTGLIELSLPGNALQVIEGLDTLSALRSLSLAQNGIRKIDGLGGLTSLKTLDLNDNIISKVENIDQISGITNFMIRKNKLDSWHDLYQLLEIKNLLALTLEMNPIYRSDIFMNLMKPYSFQLGLHLPQQNKPDPTGNQDARRIPHDVASRGSLSATSRGVLRGFRPSHRHLMARRTLQTRSNGICLSFLAFRLKRAISSFFISFFFSNKYFIVNFCYYLSCIYDTYRHFFILLQKSNDFCLTVPQRHMLILDLMVPQRNAP